MEPHIPKSCFGVGARQTCDNSGLYRRIYTRLDVLYFQGAASQVVQQ